MRRKADKVDADYFKTENFNTLTATKRHRKFVRAKDQTLEKHESIIVFYTQFPKNSCSENYTGETGRRLIERVIDLNGNDTKSRVFQDAIEKKV